MIQEGEDDVALLLNSWVLILWLKMKRVFAARTELWRSYLTLTDTINTPHSLIIALVWSIFELFHVNRKQLNVGPRPLWMAFTSFWVMIAHLINGLNLCSSSRSWNWDGTKQLVLHLFRRALATCNAEEERWEGGMADRVRGQRNGLR